MDRDKLDPEQVEQIVQLVIRRLLADGVSVTSADQPAAETELVLDQPVVTLAALDGKLTGFRRLVVPRRAVVTPSVRDELRNRKIELIRR